MDSGTNSQSNSNSEDPYLILGINEGASFDAIQEARDKKLTEAGDDQRVLWKLIPLLWKRHGREDVALSALLLANLDCERAVVDPWVVLASSINSTEPAEALLLSIEEVFRAGHDGPSDELLKTWCEGRVVESHLALISAFAGMNADMEIGSEVINRLALVNVPDGDSLLGRIRDRVASVSVAKPWATPGGMKTVSYTHLTLQTILLL